MTQKSAIVNDETSHEPIFAREGEEVAWTIPISGVRTGISSPVMYFYKKGSNSDVSSTYWTGSMSVSGVDTIVTKTTTALKAGDWTISIFATIDGQLQNAATVPMIVKRKSDP